MQRRDRPKNIPLICAIAQLGWSYSKTARLAGIDKTTLSKLICQRQDATPETQEKLAKVLGVPSAQLFPVEVRHEYPPANPFTVQWEGGRFIRRDDIAAVKRTSKTHTKTPPPDLDTMKKKALDLLNGKILPLDVYVAQFMRATGLTDKRERLARAELVHAGAIAISSREPKPPGRKFIGGPQEIAALEEGWNRPQLAL